jgi:hypothetical protein
MSTRLNLHIESHLINLDDIFIEICWIDFYVGPYRSEKPLALHEDRVEVRMFPFYLVTLKVQHIKDM